MKSFVGRNRRLLGVVAAFALLAVVVGGFALFAPDSDEQVRRAGLASSTAEPSTSPSADASSTPSPDSPSAEAPSRSNSPGPVTMSPREAERAAVRAIQEYIDRANTVLQRPDGDLTALAEVASGVAYSEIESAVAEYRDMKWRQSGASEIAGAEPAKVNVRKKPETVRLDVCVDTSAVDVVDASGTSVRGPAGQPPAHTLHHYVVTHRDGEWAVTGHSFPDEADC